ncbi:phosphotransferase family protein [Nocardioides seonyuensis]|uniref:phosphotransferase family protein n=1 Tax=Nocardioides seonyuensis TaxID=2518371 RepID=UPI001FC9F2D6|nr:phosphotransferase [Nocardioides seonyuensis]
MGHLDSVTAVTPRQRALLEEWLPGAEVVADLSWGLAGTTVLHVRRGEESYVVKAGGDSDHHIARELRAHREWLRPWTEIDRAPVLVHADDEAKLLVTRFLPGELVEGHPSEGEPWAYREAGHLLAVFHAQLAVEDATYEARANEKTLAWLSKPHRIDAHTEARLRDGVTSWPTPPATLVPTHGDWQPRNWLVHEGVVSVIDFGRADLRPAWTDFSRLAARQFLADRALEEAFLEGYGDDPRDPDAWRRERIREAVATAVWAHQVGDEAFEEQGHRMIADALTD